MRHQAFQKIISRVSSDKKSIKIDTPVSRAFNCFLVLVILSFSTKIGYELCVGSPISCGFDSPKTKGVLGFCLKNAVFDLPRDYNDICLDEYSNNSGPINSTNSRDFSLLLILFSVMCYLPKLLWNFKEGGLLSNILNGTCLVQDTFPTKDSKTKKPKYFPVFLFTECAYLAVFMIIFMIGTLASKDFEFASYGYKENSACSKSFQTTVFCKYQYFDKTDNLRPFKKTLCTLHINELNQHIMFYMWWLIIISSIMALINVLVWISAAKSLIFRQKVLAHIMSSIAKKHEIAYISQECSLDVFLVLLLLHFNSEKEQFIKIVKDFVSSFKDQLELREIIC